ncbi:MAG TPA: histidinol dehydrogenase [Egibacteraceae bacterium]|nr:histidinol dehydrogenase [Egibacteraceae bacterium]
MLRVIDLRAGSSDPRQQLPRAPSEVVSEARRSVQSIVEAVRAEGDAAVLRYSAQFDGWTGGDLEVTQAEIDEAVRAIDPALLAALERAAEQIRWFHERARSADWREERAGAVLGVRFRPLRRVGVYVPGGLGAYPSTLLMTVLPARVAGVGEIILCTPPGHLSPVILAAAAVAGGADRILRIGGAQAIAAMAYGTAAVPRCDKIVGPGNQYVALAKQAVAAEGACGIDGLAGPTEVAIIADDTADPRLVAADLVAQAEHDALAGCLLITPSSDLAERVQVALKEEVEETLHADRVRAAFDGQGAIALVADLAQAVEVADAYAAEHLEVQTADAVAVAEQVRSAGAIFVGPNSPVALGDYCAGPNHTLPTSGTARFTGGLRTDDFVVPVNWVEYQRDALAALAPVVDALAEAENLPAHSRAVRARLEDRP